MSAYLDLDNFRKIARHLFWTKYRATRETGYNMQTECPVTENPGY
jgi:hypothetical protein